MECRAIRNYGNISLLGVTGETKVQSVKKRGTLSDALKLYSSRVRLAGGRRWQIPRLGIAGGAKLLREALNQIGVR